LQVKLPWKQRIDCFKALHVIDIATGDKGDPYFPSRLKILGAWAKDATAPGEAIQLVNEFIYDSERFKQVGKLRSLADGADDATSTILWKALFNVLNSPLSKPDQKKQVQGLVNKNPRDLGFFYAIADLGLTGFDKQLQEGMKGDNSLQNNAAKAAMEAGKKALERKGKKIAQLDLADVTKAVLKGRGNVKQGQQLFTKQGCVACHAGDLAAEQKGPYLGAAGAKFPREYLVESVLYPNKVVAQGFQTVKFDLKDGAAQMGFVTAEADGVITLRNIAGQVFNLKRADVKEEKHLPQSMMPEGLAAGLTVEELTSLIEYLGTLKAIGG
ncbi:MAG: c-type cytochrome, partial [Opitutales bacterium]|nr:c-type cytochrome [Opitutales bacterium]